MALDIGYELADLRRCGVGLLMLNADQRSLVVLIQKPRFRQCVDRQSSADYRDEQCDVTSEEPAANLSRRSFPPNATARIGLRWSLSPKHAGDGSRKTERTCRARSIAVSTWLVAAGRAWGGR